MQHYSDIPFDIKPFEYLDGKEVKKPVEKKPAEDSFESLLYIVKNYDNRGQGQLYLTYSEGTRTWALKERYFASVDVEWTTLCQLLPFEAYLLHVDHNISCWSESSRQRILKIIVNDT